MSMLQEIKWGFSTWTQLFHLTFACIVIEIASFLYCDIISLCGLKKLMDAK